MPGNHRNIAIVVVVRSELFLGPKCVGPTYYVPPKQKTNTPLKFNMEPENQEMEKDIRIGNHHFEVPC